MYLDVRRFVSELSASVPEVTHCSVLFDGHIVWGSRHAAIDLLYKYLRMYCHNIMHNDFVTDPGASVEVRGAC